MIDSKNRYFSRIALFGIMLSLVSAILHPPEALAASRPVSASASQKWGTSAPTPALAHSLSPVPTPAPTPPPAIPRDGRLIRQSGQATVYVMEYGRKRGIASDIVFLGFGYGWNAVLSLPDVTYIPTGTMLNTSNQRHVRGSVVVGRGTDRAVYFLGASQRYPFTSWPNFTAWGLTAADILPASSHDLILPVGLAVSAPSAGDVLGEQVP